MTAMDDNQEWNVFLICYASVIAVYGCFAFSTLVVQILMWAIRRSFNIETVATPDHVTIEKRIAAALIAKSSAAQSDGSISSTPSTFLEMSSVSSIAHLDVRSLLEEHSVEPVIVKIPSTAEIIQSVRY
ncbi:uncharacterized protein LOC110445413 isoform X2 [Mizuhopecten yessoensis]|nr:uncharacterized protein LOC110445413 isoform X2 [Mizuhopecten yessoensis]XP_021345701.1 uncharacterized protein LOC110445413 isoform X2 [Mizuhopecten yessoensis]